LTEDTDNNEEINRIDSLTSLLHEVEDDIKQNAQFISAFEKISERFKAVARRKGGVSHSTKRRTSEKSGRRPLKNKENEDPHEMNPRKKRTTRKPHNLAKKY
ncbi:6396_t:CDS:2, partial [Gigaspora margarita]